MFERFTERARQVVVLSQDEARALGHEYIGTEHILLGLLREEEGIASRALESLDVTVEEVRTRVVGIVGPGDAIACETPQIPFTWPAKKVLELSLREALSLGHNYIGTEHILLALVRVNKGVAARILLDLDADAEKIQKHVLSLLAGPEEALAMRSEIFRQSEPESGPNIWAGLNNGFLRGPLYAAIGCAAAAFPFGLLVGWLIWA